MSAFKKLQSKIEKKEGYSKEKAGAITAAIGRKKYGNSVMKKAAAKGVSAKSVMRKKKS